MPAALLMDTGGVFPRVSYRHSLSIVSDLYMGSIEACGNNARDKAVWKDESNPNGAKVHLKKGAVMKSKAVVKSFTTIAFLLACLIALPAARADEANQATKLTFNRSIQISGHVLPAGTYWFVLASIDSPSIVRVFNSDRSRLYATIFTVNAERLNTTDNTAITFAERGFAQPQAIVYWFYPGSTIGHEFLYPKQVQTELAKDKQYTVVAGY
jgi:hypothetical protein